MNRSLAAAAIVLMFAPVACASPEPAPQRTAASARPQEARDCISASQIINRRAEDAQTIRFDVAGGRSYVNRLGGECPGLRHAANGFGALAFDTHGDQLCRGDLVRVLDSGGSVGSRYRTAVPCPLGAFEPVPREAPRRR